MHARTRGRATFVVGDFYNVWEDDRRRVLAGARDREAAIARRRALSNLLT